jgi:hypothetical protein
VVAAKTAALALMAAALIVRVESGISNDSSGSIGNCESGSGSGNISSSEGSSGI